MPRATERHEEARWKKGRKRASWDGSRRRPRNNQVEGGKKGRQMIDRGAHASMRTVFCRWAMMRCEAVLQEQGQRGKRRRRC